MNKSTILRRVLAIILFLQTTVGLILVLDHLDTFHWFKEYITSSSDVSTYILYVYLLISAFLLIVSLWVSQNCQFLISRKDLDERSMQVKKEIILTTFTKTFWLLIVWLLLKFASSFALVPTTSDNALGFWHTYSVYFVILPILVLPFCVALWMDAESELKNPFLSNLQFARKSLKIVLVGILIILSFQIISLSSFLEKKIVNLNMNKNKIVLVGDAKYKVILDSTLEYGSVKAVGKEINLTDFAMSGQMDKGGADFVYDYNSLNSSIEVKQENLKDNQGTLYVENSMLNTTSRLFGLPEVIITVPELKELTVRNSKSVELVTPGQKCIEQEYLKIVIENKSNLKLPCMTGVKKLDLQDLN
jgi:hypothetical protein